MKYTTYNPINRVLFVAAALSCFLSQSNAQGVGIVNKWLSVGSLQSWYSSVGFEIEEGRVKVQQDGLQWPALYQNQDTEAAKGFWIGAANWRDATGTVYPHKVVHCGPRVQGLGEGPDGGFFPVKFELVSKFEAPTLTVDGVASVYRTDEIERIDPTMKADRMIFSVVNTSLGITMTKKIMAFSQGFHDSYIVHDYEFKNTGNTNYDDVIELPSQTVDSLYFFFQYRNAISKDACIVLGNSSRWGINTMNDARVIGRTLPDNDTSGAGLRCQFSWHGKYQSWTRYDNLGGPIFDNPYYDKADTIGRLGAAQFVGVVTLHADRSATDSTDDPAQPRTTSYKGSDDPLNSRNDQYSVAGMNNEYAWMREGNVWPPHAYVVEPLGKAKFVEPTADPSLGTSGGWSFAQGYGPYRLVPGQKVRIVFAEAAGGLSREKQVSVGRRFKSGAINARAKNDSVFTGRDSLFQTFRRAIANYNAGYNIPQAPLPPKSVTITSGGDKITIAWELYDDNDPNLAGFRVYRTIGRFDADTVKLLYTAGRTERKFDDTTAIRGSAYYYHVIAYGNPSSNPGGGGTPAGVSLTSNRVYSQTYDPAFLKRAAGPQITSGALPKFAVVPNPFIIEASPSLRAGPGTTNENRIYFFDIPGYCTIKIYTELGELIKTINHSDGSGDASWDCITSSDQLVVSGIYIAVIEDAKSGGRAIAQFAVIR
jgi:hypothetical protein